MTPERLADIRAALRTGRRRESYVFIGRELLKALDERTRELDEARKQAEERGQMLFDEQMARQRAERDNG